MRRLLLPFVCALALAPSALAQGGNYVVDGGTRAEQLQVKAALDASSFDFSVVPGTVAIQIERGVAPYSTPGRIVLDAGLLDTGRLSWGVVQHEYAHQVDFALLTDPLRARLETLVGGSSWWSGSHDSLACERFADALAWAYWPSPDNVLRPDRPLAEQFRATLALLIPGVSGRSIAAVARKHRTPKG